MKKASTFIIVLIVINIPLQSCAQPKPCPANNKKAEKVLKKYLAKERNIQSLRDQYDMPINNNAKEKIKSLSGEKYKEECQELLSNLEWLEKTNNYSTYKVASHYFIVIYSFDENSTFKMDEIPIINNEYKAIGSIIDLGDSE